MAYFVISGIFENHKNQIKKIYSFSIFAFWGHDEKRSKNGCRQRQRINGRQRTSGVDGSYPVKLDKSVS